LAYSALEAVSQAGIILVAETLGFVSDITARLVYQLLRDDPEARLVVHMRAGGAVSSGYRVHDMMPR